MVTIDIPVRELHARTGHYIRKVNENLRIVVTDRGRPVAEIQILDKGEVARRKWRDRVLLPEFKKVMKKRIGGTGSSQIVSEDRDRGASG